MFGHLLLVVKEAVIKNFGIKKWEDVKKKCVVKEEITECGQYEMSLFDRMIKVSVEQCGIKEEAFLKLLGEAYLFQLQANGNNQLLRVLGKSLLEFLQNIDFIHTLALGKYPNANIPFFKVDTETQGPNYIRLHYFSNRKNLSPMIESLLETISRVFFKKTLKIQILEEDQQGERHHILYSLNIQNLADAMNNPPTLIAQTRKNAEQQIHEKNVTDQKEKIELIRKEYGEAALPVARARNADSRWKAALKMNIMYSRMLPTIPKSLSIGPKDFCELFPYHFVFDQTMSLKQSGIQIQAIIPDFRRINIDICKYLQLIHPKHDQFTYENVENLICSPHVVRVTDNRLTAIASQDNEIYLRGQMMKLTENQCILFLCSPMVSSLNDIERNGMKMSEIPNHDVTKYFSSFQTIGKGDWTDRFLGRDDPLAEDNTNTVMYDQYAILAGTSTISGLINNSLREGRKYKNCYILFCDIVHFSTIVTNAGPSEVLDMLNNLHNEFDRLTRVHDVQKIDSVGDAYLVVSGILDHISQRSERIANTALAMIMISKTIKSPYDYGSNFGKRALIRIGLNCGEIIGGIIGSTNPKFTVMGDSVVTASKMESHGLPDKIHITAAMYRELASSHYEMEERGCIEIRGKGRQFTYFLNRNLDVSDNALLGKTRDTVYSKK